MDSLTAVFLGMTTFKPGRATVQGTLVGVFIIGMLDNGLSLMGAPFYAQKYRSGHRHDCGRELRSSSR